MCATGCETMYREVYSPRRNHYKPVPERSTAVLPEETTTVTTTPPAVTVPTTPDASTPQSLPTTPAAPSDPAVIPGLDPIPGAPAMSPM